MCRIRRIQEPTGEKAFGDGMLPILRYLPLAWE
jgi:hypothetical protein